MFWQCVYEKAGILFAAILSNSEAKAELWEQRM